VDDCRFALRRMLPCLASALFWVAEAIEEERGGEWQLSFIETSRYEDGVWKFSGGNHGRRGTVTTRGVLSGYLDLPLTNIGDGRVGLLDCLQGEISVVVSSLAHAISGSETGYLLGVCMVYSSHGYHVCTICAYIIFGGCTCSTRINVALLFHPPRHSIGLLWLCYLLV
jgi:hypothetical protein